MSDGRYPRELPPLWLAAAVVTMSLLHRLAPVAVWLEDSWRSLGYVPIALGVILIVDGIVRLRRAATAVRPFEPATAVATNGSFRFSRNPMYLGMVAIAVGVALRLGTISPLLVPPLLLVVLDRRFVRREEGFLRDQLGESYVSWSRGVRRWL